MTNATIAARLTEHARRLEAAGGSNLYRIRSYRRAAVNLIATPKQATEILETEGADGLRLLPGIGTHLSYVIEQLIQTGEIREYSDAKRSA